MNIKQQQIATLRAGLGDELFDYLEESTMSLLNTIDMACGKLPEGWVVRLCMENGAAWVSCTDSHGWDMKLDPTDKTLQEQITEAVKAAIAYDKNEGYK